LHYCFLYHQLLLSYYRSRHELLNPCFYVRTSFIKLTHPWRYWWVWWRKKFDKLSVICNTLYLILSGLRHYFLVWGTFSLRKGIDLLLCAIKSTSLEARLDRNEKRVGTPLFCFAVSACHLELHLLQDPTIAINWGCSQGLYFWREQIHLSQNLVPFGRVRPVLLWTWTHVVLWGIHWLHTGPLSCWMDLLCSLLCVLRLSVHIFQ
jgi:hypothetical protein